MPLTRIDDNSAAGTRKEAGAHGHGRTIMLETLVIILVVLWLLGLVTSTTMGGFIHLLLVLAVIVLLVRLIQGRRVL